MKVTDAALSATATPVSATQGTSFSGTVATFTDANPLSKASDFTATIAWGDGTAATAGSCGDQRGRRVQGHRNPHVLQDRLVHDHDHDQRRRRLDRECERHGDGESAAAGRHERQPVRGPDGGRHQRHDHRHEPRQRDRGASSGPTNATSLHGQHRDLRSPPPHPAGSAGTVDVTVATAAAVKFGANAATVTTNTATQIAATNPAGSAGTVDVTVTNAGGTSATSANDQFTYAAVPTVTASARARVRLAAARASRSPARRSRTQAP